MKAVVCINGLPVNTWSPMRYKDIVVPGLPVHFDRFKVSLVFHFKKLR